MESNHKIKLSEKNYYLQMFMNFGPIIFINNQVTVIDNQVSFINNQVIFLNN